MENNIEQQILDYIKGKLTSEALVSFEQRLKNDTTFAQEVAFQQSLYTVFKHEKLFAAQTLLNELKLSNPVEPDFDNLPMPPLRPSIHWGWWMTGTLLICLMGIFIWTSLRKINQKEKEKIQIIGKQFLNQVPAFENHFGLSNEDSSSLAIGMRQYEVFQYDKAATNLKEHLRRTSITGDSLAQLYLGVCYLYMAKPDSAIIQLSTLTTASDNFIAQAARYHLALAYLQIGNKAIALPLLQSVLTNEEFKESTQSALDKLNR